MMKNRQLGLVASLLLVCGTASASEPVDITRFLQKSSNAVYVTSAIAQLRDVWQCDVPLTFEHAPSGREENEVVLTIGCNMGPDNGVAMLIFFEGTEDGDLQYRTMYQIP